MKNIFATVLSAIVGPFLAVIPVWGHHSITAEFDPGKNFVLRGTITEVEWENPHVYVHLAVKDKVGKVVNWYLETYPPGVLHKGGVTRQTFKEGQQVSIDAFPPKDGTKNLAYLKTITFDDGHSIEIWVGDPSQYK